MSGWLRIAGCKFDYPPIEADDVDLLLITHEHVDHNGVEAIGGEPAIAALDGRARWSRRSARWSAIASEHDDAAGTERGPNTIFAFDLDGRSRRPLRRLRPARAAARAGRGAAREPSCSSCRSAAGRRSAATQPPTIVEALGPRWVVPMHYRTPRIGFLETEEEFLAGVPHVERLPQSGFDPAELPDVDGSVAVVPAAP